MKKGDQWAENKMASYVFMLIAAFACSLFPSSEARITIYNPFSKLTEELKISYDSVDVESFDLPPLDAYDEGFSSISTSPMMGPSPVEMSPSPVEMGPSPAISDLPELAPRPNSYPPSLHQHALSPAHKGPGYAVWCVAKPTVPESMLQRAMDYACGFGGDCKSVRPSGPCFVPNTIVSHASYAFNSYWQRTKSIGGNCNFGGTAMLINVDPSFGECRFTYV